MEKLKKKLKKYYLEVFLLSLALVSTIVSGFLFLKSNYLISTNNDEISIKSTRENLSNNQKLIYIDVSGSVKNPGLYKLKTDSRLKEAVDKAGGLDENADKNFFSRNFNLSRIVFDQEKIYVPSVWEVQNGFFRETEQILNFLQPVQPVQPAGDFTNQSTQSTLININTASFEELDTLPGVGKVIGQKIINNRPYSSIEELQTKKIVNKSTYEKIKDLITVD